MRQLTLLDAGKGPTAGVFPFAATWTEFLMALTLNSQNGFRTIPVGIAVYGDRHQLPYGVIFAAAMAATVPIAVLVLAFRGAVKGDRRGRYVGCRWHRLS